MQKQIQSRVLSINKTKLSYNSTIKKKKGTCIDCIEENNDETEKNIIAGRCGFHYKKHRSEVSESKRKQRGESASKDRPKEREQYSIPKRSEKGKKLSNEDQKFFKQIWNDRPHYSEISVQFLGDQYNPVFFSHILTKAAYPGFRHNPNNIMLMTFDEHQEYEFHSRSTSEFKRKFGKVLQKSIDLVKEYYSEKK